MINIGEFYNHLNDQERKVFYTAMAALIIALFDGLFLRPVLARLDEMEEQIRSTSLAVERDLRFISYRDKILEEDRVFGKYQTDEAKSGEEIIAGFLKTIEVIASEKAVSLSRVTPADFLAKKGSIQYFASVDCSGKLTDMIAFMHAIDSTDNLLKIVRVNMSGNKASKDDVKVEMKVAKLVIDPATVGNYAFDPKEIQMPQALLDEAAARAGVPLDQQKRPLNSDHGQERTGGSGGSSKPAGHDKGSMAGSGGGMGEGTQDAGSDSSAGRGVSGGESGGPGRPGGPGDPEGGGSGRFKESGNSSDGGSAGGGLDGSGSGVGGIGGEGSGSGGRGRPESGAGSGSGGDASSGARGSAGRPEGGAGDSAGSGGSLGGSGYVEDSGENDFNLGGRPLQRRRNRPDQADEAQEPMVDDSSSSREGSGSENSKASQKISSSKKQESTELQKSLAQVRQGGRVRVESLGSLWENFLGKIMGKEEEMPAEDPGEYYNQEPLPEERNLWERKFR